MALRLKHSGTPRNFYRSRMLTRPLISSSQQRLAGDVGMPVIFLSGIVDIPTTVRAMRGGASGFLLKPVDEEQLLLTVRTALVEAHAQWVDRQLVRRIRNGYESLTLREREVLPYIVSGFSANKLHMS